MIQYHLEPIAPKTYEGDLIFVYGDEVAERTLPFSKREIELIKERKTQSKNFILSFDRLPNHTYVICFDSELESVESLEELRRLAADLHKRMMQDNVHSVAVVGEGVIPEEIVAVAEGLTLADYTFDRFYSKQRNHLEHLYIEKAFISQDELDSNVALWNRIYWCREWVNLPVANLNAASFAEELESIACDLKISCSVFDKKQIESLRMGGLLAVNKGSVDEPRFVVLEYKPQNAKNDKPIALVGKGVMYDTGGLNIKPDSYMSEMKSDMAGAATMASVVFAAADNQLPVHMVALLPLTDNRPGGNAYAADDIITMYDGTTVEVVNTDAEGRLILADAIAYAVDKFNPELIVDAATLTGAAVRAISSYGIAAMHKNAANPFNLLKIMGNQVYERIAEFPFWKEYDKLIESQIADIKNCGPAEAGTITAGKFLAHFAKNVPFVHLDIAGVAYFSKPQFYYGYGATGIGVRLLYAFLQTYEVI